MLRPAVVTLFLVGVALASPCRADDERLENAKARLEAARKVYQGMMARFRSDATFHLSSEDLYRWSRRWMEAERDLADKPEARVAAAQAHLDRMTKLEDLVRKEHTTGLVPPYEVPAAEFYRREAERALAEARKK